MSASHPTNTLPSQGALPLPDLHVLIAQGPDSASFLHGQLSQDVVHQSPDQARLAAYCSAKGRMLASTLNVRPHEDAVWLVTDASVSAALLKRLSMFVLRAKTRLSIAGDTSDAGDGVRVWGLAGASLLARLGAAEIESDGLVRAWERGHLVRLPSVQGVPRWLWLGGESDAAWLASLPALPPSTWSWLDVMSGVPRITQATADQFVPQMVNFELLGGVNFQKGCYPGQEVVARSQYRGTVKRRATLFRVDGAGEAGGVRPGQEVFAEADPSQPAGMVVLAAPWPDTRAWAALVEVKLQALGQALRLGSADGPLLTPVPLPYSLETPEGAE